MRPVPGILLSLFILSVTARAEMREFTDDKGRKIKAEVIEFGSGWIKVKRQDGSKFTLMLDKLSEEDRAWVEKEKEARPVEKETKPVKEETAATKRANKVAAKVVTYCKEQLGKQVGNGECWTLADECFKSCRLQRPGHAMRVWGRKLDLSKEQPQPGDIVEYRSVKFLDGSFTAPEHTAVVVALAETKGAVIVAHQNWGGSKLVQETEHDPAKLVSGELMFYRPK